MIAVKQYDVALSMLKGLAIILMVVGHCAPPPWLRGFIYTFHMPLFFMAAGYCFHEKYIDSKVEFLGRRLKGLWWPFVKWTLFFVLIHNLTVLVGWSTDWYSLRQTAIDVVRTLPMMHYEDLLGGFWFLKALFFGSLLSLAIIACVHALSAWITRSHESRHSVVQVTLLLVVLAVLMLASCRDHSGWFFRVVSNVSLKAAAFYLIGYLLKLTGKKPSWRCGLSLMTVAVAFYAFYEFPNGINGTISSKGFEALLEFPVATVTTVAIYGLLSKVKGSTASLLDYAGRKTLQVLTWHFSVLKLVGVLKIVCLGLAWEELLDYPVIHANNECFWLVYSFFGVAVPLAGCWFTDKLLPRFK